MTVQPVQQTVLGNQQPLQPVNNPNNQLISGVASTNAVAGAVVNNQVQQSSYTASNIAFLQMSCFTKSQLAKHSVNGVLAKAEPASWFKGVYIFFEAAVSRVFFETFATTLHGKNSLRDTYAPINVLVNASARCLGVQSDIDKKVQQSMQEMTNARHLRDLALREIAQALDDWKKSGDPFVNGFPENMDNELKKTLTLLEAWQKINNCFPGLGQSLNLSGSNQEKIEKALSQLKLAVNDSYAAFKTFLVLKSTKAGSAVEKAAGRKKSHGHLEEQLKNNPSDEKKNFLDAQFLVDKIDHAKIPTPALLDYNIASTEAERQVAKKEALKWIDLGFLLEKVGPPSAVSALERKTNLEEDEKKVYEACSLFQQHALIKVATDGRFLITKKPEAPESVFLGEIKVKVNPLLVMAQTYLKLISDKISSTTGNVTISGQTFTPAELSAERDRYDQICAAFKQGIERIDARKAQVELEEKQQGVSRQVPSALGEIFVKAVGPDLIKVLDGAVDEDRKPSLLKLKLEEEAHEKARLVALARQKEQAQIAANQAQKQQQVSGNGIISGGSVPSNPVIHIHSTSVSQPIQASDNNVEASPKTTSESGSAIQEVVVMPLESAKPTKIGFFRAVDFGQEKKSCGQSALETVDKYFYLGGKKAYVIQGKTNEVQVKVFLSESRISLLARIALVFSYLTLIIPLMMLFTKAILRSAYSFQLIENYRKPEKGR